MAAIFVYSPYNAGKGITIQVNNKLNGKDLYRAICKQDTDLPLFHQYWWLDSVAPDWNVSIAMKGQSITGVWPYAMQQRLRIDMLRLPMLTPYLGPHVFYPADIKETNRDQFEHEVVEQLISRLPDPDVWHLALQPGTRQAGIFHDYDLQLHVRQTFLLDLSQPEDDLFSHLREPLRRNIRAAEKEITITDDPRCLGDLFHFQKITLEYKGASQHYTLEDLARVYEACRQHHCTALWVAKKQDEVQAIIWHLWDKKNSYYYMGAKNPGTDSYRAMSALLWHAIRKAKEQGNQWFDFEGSMDPGVERFFRNFGARRELYMVLRKNRSLLWQLIERLRR